MRTVLSLRGADPPIPLEGWRKPLRPAWLPLLLCLCAPACNQPIAGRQETGAPPRDVLPVSGAELPAGAEDTQTAVAVAVGPEGGSRVLAIDTVLVVDQDVTLMARMTGIVEEILVDRGARVRKGDLLLRLMNRDLMLSLKKAGVIAEQMRTEFERAQQLIAEKAISSSQFDAARFAFEGANVDVEIAREDLERSFVRAPFAGVIVDRFARLGQKVVEDADEPLFRLTALSPLQARLYLSEEVARALHEGDQVDVRPRYLPEASFAGTIEWVSRIIDASSGTSQAIVSVPAGGNPLTPGTAVTITLEVPAAGAGVLIPPAALEHGIAAAPRRITHVQVLEEGARVRRRVRLGEVHEDGVQVLEGLRPGEKVVLNNGEGAEVVESR